jgi:hypothetical protein
MSGTPGIVYLVSIVERKTLGSPDLTIGWIRNVGGVRKRGRPLCRLTRVLYNTLDVNKFYSMVTAVCSTKGVTRKSPFLIAKC